MVLQAVIILQLIKQLVNFIMLLNNDTVVTRGWLTNVVKHMSNDPKCGMCGSVTNSIGNEAMIGVNYKNIENWTVLRTNILECIITNCIQR